MEQVPYKARMGRDEALAFARNNKVAWNNAQYLALEEHLVNAVQVKFGLESSQVRDLDLELRKLNGYDLNGLKSITHPYKDLLSDYDLEQEGLRVFCEKQKIELIS